MNTNTDPVRAHKPCGGCGNADPEKVCVGCLHDFAAAPSGEAVGAWVTVPRTPTLAMANAAWRELESQGIDPEDVETPQVWGAMLAAAPQQPAGVDEAETTRIVANALRSTGLVTNSDKWRAAEAVIAALAAQQQEPTT